MIIKEKIALDDVLAQAVHKLREAICEEDEILVYLMDSNTRVSCCRGDSPKALRILDDHPERVVGYYDYRISAKELRDDLKDALL